MLNEIQEKIGDVVEAYVGPRPKPQRSEGGLLEFGADLQAAYDALDYQKRFELGADLLLLFNRLLSFFPDSKSLVKRFPVFAPIVLMLLLSACDITPKEAGAADLNLNTKNNQPTAQVDPTRVSEDSMLREAIKLFGETGAEQSDRDLAVAATPTPTPTSRLTNEQVQPTETQVPYAIVNSDGSRLRSGPGLGFDILTKLKQDDRVTILGISPDRKWLKIITTSGLTGFMSRELVDIPSGVSNINIVDVPSTPTPSPTRVKEVRPTREVKTTPATVTNNSGQPVAIYTIVNGALILSDHKLDNGSTVEVINRKNQAIYIRFPGLPGALILNTTAGLTYNEGGTQTTVAVPTPVPPEVVPTSTGTYYSGLSVGDFVFGSPIELNYQLGSPDNNRRHGNEYTTVTISPVTTAFLAPEGIAAYQESPITFTVGEVVRDADGRYSVAGIKLDNSFKIYFFTHKTDGTNSYIKSNLLFRDNMVQAGVVIGVTAGAALIFYD